MTINGSKPGKYGKDFMKIKFNSDDNWPLNKTMKFHNMAMIVRCVSEKDGKVYPQNFFRRVFVWVINARLWQNWYFRRNWYQ